MASRPLAFRPLAFRDVVALAAGQPDADATARALQPLFADIGWLTGMNAHWIAEMRADPLLLPPYSAARAGTGASVILATEPPVTLLVTRIGGTREPGGPPPSTQASITFSGQLCLTRLLGTRSLTGRLVTAQPGATRCRSRPIRLTPGKTMTIDERRTTLWLDPAPRPAFLLRARIARTPAPLARRFNLATGALTSTTLGDRGFARAAMLLSLLRAADARDAVPAIIELLESTQGRDRWTVMRELLALDADAAWPHLEAMATDAEEEDVRTAALVTLRRHGEPPCPA